MELFVAIAKAIHPRLSTSNDQDLSNTAWAFTRCGFDLSQSVRVFVDELAEEAKSRNLGRPSGQSSSSLSKIEDCCSEIIQGYIPNITRKQYAFGFELDLILQPAANREGLVNIEIDGPYHLSENQSKIDGRRDFLRNAVGVRVVRFTHSQKLGDVNE